MGSNPSVQPELSSALFGKIRRAILALLFSHPDESFYLRQNVRLVRSGQGGVQREVKRLADAHIILRTDRGRTTFYQANHDSPVFDELQRLVVKTAGVAEVLRAALGPLEERIEVAFLYGSAARARLQASSDVDLLVVGAVGFGDVVDRLSSAQTQLGREVDPTVFVPHEFEHRIRRRDHFVRAVMDAPKVFVIGGQHELEQPVRRRMADRP